MIRSVSRRLVLGALACASLSAHGSAQDFSNRPITLVVGLAAGGITDVTARLYGESVSKLTGQRVIVENRTGAGGGVGAAMVQNATPDGYTLLVFSGSQHATVVAAGGASYEPVKGFAPVTFLFNSVVVLAVPSDSPAQSMKELHELGRKKSGGLTFGTPGLGSPSHLLGAKVLLADNVPFETVHYRGGAPMMADLITGRVDFGWPTLSTSGAYLAEKKLRALAIDTDARLPRMADVPTLMELGYGKERVASWFALAAPAGTPPAVVSKLNELFVKASQDPELKRRLDANGTPIETSTPEAMGRAMEQEWQNMQELVKRLNLRPS
jgi:tripartite-type tricarboxylate transporter receptor subunit TctC